MREEGRGFKRVYNQMGEARPINLPNIATWLISTCSHPRPFCLCLGDRALTPCVLALFVYRQRQRQETSRQAMEGKIQRAYERGIKQISMIDMARKETRKRAKQARRQRSKKANKRWCSQGTNVGLDRMSITSLC